MNMFLAVLFSLVAIGFLAILASVAISLRAIASDAAVRNRATIEVAREMGVEYAQEPVEAGLYHPTFEDTQASFAKRQGNLHKENFDPMEDWGKESIFDVPTPAGLYHDGE